MKSGSVSRKKKLDESSSLNKDASVPLAKGPVKKQKMKENLQLVLKSESFDEESENMCFAEQKFGGSACGLQGAKLTMTDEYFLYVEKYQKLYGNNTVVLLQNGSFFEMYGVDNEKEKFFPEIRQVCDVLDIYLSRKNKSILENGRNNPLMAGFPTWSYQKHIQNLLDSEYTVVIFEQKEIEKGVFERVLSEILSPSISIEYSSKNVDGLHCVTFYVKQGIEYFSKVEFWMVSASVIDVTTGRIFLYEITHSRMEKRDSVFFDMIRLCKTHAPQEIIIVVDGECFETNDNYWRKQLGYANTLHMVILHENGLAKIFENGVTIDKIRKISYQIHFFNKVYAHISINSSIDKISYCNLEHNDNMRISLIILLQFVYNHNRSLLDKISKPEWCEYLESAKPKFMKIENNSMEQIGLFTEGGKKKTAKCKLNCVFDVINETKTPVGHRFLKESLTKPLIDVDMIRKRQRDISTMKNSQNTMRIDSSHEKAIIDKLTVTRENLAKINDLERIHRKIQLNLRGMSLCFEFAQLENSYNLLMQTLTAWIDIFTTQQDSENIEHLSEALEFIRQKLDIGNCTNTPRSQNIELQIFNPGHSQKLDNVFARKDEIMRRIETERLHLDNIIHDYESETVSSKTGGARKKKDSPKIQGPTGPTGPTGQTAEQSAAEAVDGAEKQDAQTKKITKRPSAKTCRITTKQILLQKLAQESQDKHAENMLENQQSVDANTSKHIVKLEYNEKEKFYFSISNAKCKILQECFIKNADLQTKYKIKNQVSNAKITDAGLEKLNDEYTDCLHEIDRISKDLFQEFVSEFNTRFGDYFTVFNYFAGYLDFIQSGAYISIQNNYACPEVVDDSESFIDCKDLRHPLVEKILLYSAYIPNDICIGKEKNGYLIFGTNSCGKSVFMKSVGLAVIMAQIGYDVACRSMKFSPFNNIITRMSGNDDQLRGQSSFAVEMIELNLILSRSSKNSLILGDEICHGTEQVSGISLVASALIHLCQRRVPFVFASHLHHLSKMDCVLELDGLAMKHLTVRRERCDMQNTLIYERKLKDGSGDATYGIEVAKYIIENQDFIHLAEKIQKVVEERELNIVSERVSRYNRMLLLDKCQVCGSRANETHHIIQQKDADERKMVESAELGMKISMNHFTNLVALCEECHLSIHGKRGRQLHIMGYEDTASGLELKYEWKI